MKPGFIDQISKSTKKKEVKRKKVCKSFMTKSTGHFKNVVKVNRLYENILLKNGFESKSLPKIDLSDQDNQLCLGN